MTPMASARALALLCSPPLFSFPLNQPRRIAESQSLPVARLS
ncbi:hypothetical protein FB481_101354 [Pseudomonas sp. AG1028]|uniref:Uncharacterized protein n=1 Tax=Pseudomonas straminea TaxID=47882 RepID=A0A1I1VEJ1_PSEOC|nr:hypothetical protein FB481_101354 [Pseudomonas sp. AG1028]SFD81482.1 hypothetical protein SAMN05216372_104291 [Pseudomonas straminea]